MNREKENSFKYKRDIKTPIKMPLDESHDFENLNVIERDQNIMNQLNKKLIKFNTPTKNLKKNFDEAEIDDNF